MSKNDDNVVISQNRILFRLTVHQNTRLNAYLLTCVNLSDVRINTQCGVNQLSHN